MTLLAPKALATIRVTIPIGPAPLIKTFDPRVTAAFLQAWTPTDKGSNRAPSSRVTLSGSLKIPCKKIELKSHLTED